jgi:hypothetical protein
MGFLFGWGLMGVLPSSPTLLALKAAPSGLGASPNIGRREFYFFVVWRQYWFLLVLFYCAVGALLAAP